MRIKRLFGLIIIFIFLTVSSVQGQMIISEEAIKSHSLIASDDSELIVCFSEIETLDSVYDNLNSGSITKIDLRCNRIQDISLLNHMSNENIQKIESINLSGNEISDLSPLKEFTNLKYLYLEDNRIDDISPLSDLNKLEILHLSSNSITDLSPLEGLTKLNRLYLSNNTITDIESLSKLESLETLFLANNNLITIDIVKNLYGLKSLDVSYNKIENITALEEITKLEYLNLASNKISELNLAGLDQLKSLFISENPVEDTHILYPKAKVEINDFEKNNNFKSFVTQYDLLQDNILVMEAHNGTIWASEFKGTSLFKSNDYGNNWGFVYDFEVPINAVYCDDYNNIFVTVSFDRFAEVGTGKMYKSTDNGSTFYKVLDIESGVAVHWNIASDGELMLTSEYGYKKDGNNARRIYRSIDHGDTWEIVYEPEEKINYHNHKILICENDTIYQSIGDWGHCGILKSTDDGSTWNKILSNIHPTSAVELNTHILWGLDAAPISGVVRFNKTTEKIDSIFTVPYPFRGSCYDMKEVDGVIYAMFLSYANGYQPASIYYSEDEGLTWKCLGYIEKELHNGIGLYNLAVDEKYGYINFGSPIYNNDTVEDYRGTLRFSLLKKQNPVRYISKAP